MANESHSESVRFENIYSPSGEMFIDDDEVRRFTMIDENYDAKMKRASLDEGLAGKRTSAVVCDFDLGNYVNKYAFTL
jgi:hypothetical protein